MTLSTVDYHLIPRASYYKLPCNLPFLYAAVFPQEYLVPYLEEKSQNLFNSNGEHCWVYTHHKKIEMVTKVNSDRDKLMYQHKIRCILIHLVSSIIF